MHAYAVLVLLALTAAPAAAAKSLAPPRDDSPSAERHYGPAVGVAYALPLGVMLASVGLSALDARSHETDERYAEPLVYGLLALPVAVLAPPIVHWGHGNAGGGFGSLAGSASTAVVGFVLGGVIGSGVASGDGTLKSLDRASAHGAFLGVVLLEGFWAVIDANELARLPDESSGPRDSAARSVQSLRVGIAPVNDASRGAVLLSLTAAF